jgi:hypothetical protein
MTAIVSFTIALLPFFDPDPADIRKYESINIGMVTDDTPKYLAVLEKEKAFRSLAWYCLVVKMDFRTPTLSDGLKEMAKKFATEPSSSMGIETSMRGIFHAIESWRPFVKETQVSKETAEAMAQHVVNMLLVEYARTDTMFDVIPNS